VRFFDSSAVVKLYIQEDHSDRIRRWLQPEASVVSRLAEVEVSSALSRGVRAKILSPNHGERAIAAFRADLIRWQVMEVSPQVVAEAVDLTWRHSLGAADALQLGSALTFVRATGQALDGFVAFDQRLIEAARAESLRVD
jgi:predicted nucleic acid-binding protein